MDKTEEQRQWYLADLVVSIHVENDSRNVIHINTVLVQAYSSESAYEAAMELGKEENNSYLNPEGNKVVFKFRGIKDLYKIYDELEHGAEIIYEEKTNISEEDINEMITAKKDLAIFTSRKIEDKPNYLSKEIYDDMIKADFSKEELE